MSTSTQYFCSSHPLTPVLDQGSNDWPCNWKTLFAKTPPLILRLEKLAAQHNRKGVKL